MQVQKKKKGIKVKDKDAVRSFAAHNDDNEEEEEDKEEEEEDHQPTRCL